MGEVKKLDNPLHTSTLQNRLTTAANLFKRNLNGSMGEYEVTYDVLAVASANLLSKTRHWLRQATAQAGNPGVIALTKTCMFQRLLFI